MTALTEYQRLESQGIWRATPEAQRRDVIVSLGDATLILYDMADRALGHWSLPALERVNPGEMPAVYIPGEDAPEELELDDADMIAAIEKVRDAIARRRPHPGRLRFAILGLGLAAVLALTVFWLPDALVRHTASVVPAAARADLGHRLLSDVQRLTGRICAASDGLRALDRLHARLLPGSPGQIVVLSGDGPATAHLPGGLVLVNRRLVEDYEDPAVVAGYVLAEADRAAARDPVERFLDEAGPLTAFRLLTTGVVTEPALAAHAEALIARDPARRPDEALLTRFAAAGVPTMPYAYALDTSGETTLGLIEADPLAERAMAPILPDGDWVSLQGICAG